MEDRFKLRVWEKSEKRMLYGKEELFDDMIGWRFGHFEIDTSDFEDLILLQCTGLKDKNGKLIFEGDVLNNGTITREVWFNNQHGLRAMFGLDQLTRYDAGGEIIGNIYENPGLKDKI